MVVKVTFQLLVYILINFKVSVGYCNNNMHLWVTFPTSPVSLDKDDSPLPKEKGNIDTEPGDGWNSNMGVLIHTCLFSLPHATNFGLDTSWPLPAFTPEVSHYHF